MNEYVETAKKIITGTASKVAETSNTLYSTAKLSLQISKLKAKVDDCYKKLGEVCYLNYKGIESSEDDAEALCLQVDDMKEKIEKLSIEIAEIKGLEVCKNCGAEVGKDSDYCAKCGTEL